MGIVLGSHETLASRHTSIIPPKVFPPSLPLQETALLNVDTGILWRDKMYVPSQCTIVGTMGRSAYSSKPNTQKKQLHSVSVKKAL
jgi:hypothetical protein